jgi:hypothetical protein
MSGVMDRITVSHFRLCMGFCMISYYFISFFNFVSFRIVKQFGFFHIGVVIGPRSAVLGPITRPIWKKSRNDTILYIEREHIMKVFYIVLTDLTTYRLINQS